jgi:hypothetical protein
MLISGMIKIPAQSGRKEDARSAELRAQGSDDVAKNPAAFSPQPTAQNNKWMIIDN